MDRDGVENSREGCRALPSCPFELLDCVSVGVMAVLVPVVGLPNWCLETDMVRCLVFVAIL
jgi:hypothetical protein